MSDFKERFEAAKLLNKAEKVTKKLVVTKDTYLKYAPLSIKWLNKRRLLPLEAGEIVEYQTRIDVGTHSKIIFDSQDFYYVEDACVQYEFEPGIEEVELDVPYFSMADQNVEIESAAACCIGMVFSFFSVPPLHPTTILSRGFDPDDVMPFPPSAVENYAKEKGYDLFMPSSIVKIFNDYGINDAFSQYTSFERIKRHIRAGNPVIYHGGLMRHGGVIVLIGIKNGQYVVHDPFGKLQNGRGKYISNEKFGKLYGKSVVYDQYILSSRSYAGATHCWAHLLG